MNRFSMLFQKINSKYLVSLFFIFTNFWIYKILNADLFTGILLIVLTLAIILTSNKKIILVCLVILALFQYQTASIKNITSLDNDEQRVQSERIKSYPPTYIDLGIKVIWLKPADWIEKNKLLIGLSRIEKNLFESLDVNRYFFGSFPRNKPEDFEKFSFACLPVFIIGAFFLIKKKLLWELGILLIFPVLLLSFLGISNRFGPFILFPFFVLSFLRGFYSLEKKFKSSNFFYYTFILSILLSFILQISYGKN